MNISPISRSTTTDSQREEINKPVKPTVSLGLPVFNGADHIKKSIVSILNQTYENWELIIVDNASTDKTSAICKAFQEKDSRISYHRNNENIGAARNYNSCVSKASGKYFKWCSDDDFINDIFLEKAVACLEANQDVALVQSSVYEFGCSEKHLQNSHLPSLLSNQKTTRLLNFLNWFDGDSRPEPIFGVLRMKHLQQTSLIQSFIGSDYVLLWELCILGKFGRVNDIVLFKRYEIERNDQSRKNYIHFSQWFDPTNKVSVYVPLLKMIASMNQVISFHQSEFNLQIRIRLFKLIITNWKPILSQVRSGLIYYLAAKRSDN